MSRVHLIATGGTIASRTDPATGASVPVDSGADLVAAVPGLDGIAEVSVEEVAQVSSWDVTPALQAAVARTIAERAAGPDAPDGFVVTHGTDTMEETAFALDTLLDVEQPVVLTGAMRSADHPEPDGPENLRAAVRVAADPAARRIGAVVVMNREVHAARWVTKTHTTSVDTFASPGGESVGTVRDGVVRIEGAVRSALPRLPIVEPVDDVPLVTMVAGLGEMQLNAAEEAGVGALVLAGSGAGNVRGALRPTLERLVDAGVVVILASRCHGPVTPTYGGDGGGVTLVEIGLIPARDISPYKARLAVAFLLGDGADAARIRGWFGGLTR